MVSTLVGAALAEPIGVADAIQKIEMVPFNKSAATVPTFECLEPDTSEDSERSDSVENRSNTVGENEEKTFKKIVNMIKPFLG